MYNERGSFTFWHKKKKNSRRVNKQLKSINQSKPKNKGIFEWKKYAKF